MQSLLGLVFGLRAKLQLITGFNILAFKVKKMKTTIKFQNKELAVFEYGNVNASNTLLFVHGSGNSSRIWDKQINDPKLLEKCRLVTFDLPGHGESSHFEQYSVALFCEALITVANKISTPTYSIISLSLGADIMLQSIEKLTSCEGVLLCSNLPLANPPRMDLTLKAEPLFMHYLSRVVSLNAVKEIKNAAFSNQETAPKFFEDDFISSDGSYRETLAAEIGSGNYSDEVNALQNFLGIKHLVYGKNDPFLNLEYLNTKPYTTISEQNIHILNNSGHFPNWEEAETFNSILHHLVE